MSPNSFLIQLPLSSNSFFYSNSARSFAVVANVVAYVVMNFFWQFYLRSAAHAVWYETK